MYVVYQKITGKTYVRSSEFDPLMNFISNKSDTIDPCEGHIYTKNQMKDERLMVYVRNDPPTDETIAVYNSRLELVIKICDWIVRMDKSKENLSEMVYSLEITEDASSKVLDEIDEEYGTIESDNGVSIVGFEGDYSDLKYIRDKLSGEGANMILHYELPDMFDKY